MNEATNPACEACGALLGGAGAEVLWIIVSATITALIAIVTLFLGLASAALVPALVWGPLIAAWVAPRDVLWSATIGGLVGGVVLVVSALLLDDTLHPLLAILSHGVNPVVTVLRAAVLLLAVPATALPLCYAGASAGARLAERRRRELAVILANVSSGLDRELANIRL